MNQQGESFIPELSSSPIAEHPKPEVPVSLSLGIPEGFNTWSKCKQQAWNSYECNPNAYYYRFLDPKEEKKSGAWDNKEKALFIKAIGEHGGEVKQWGLFSRSIPGRTGYQCANFYRKLVAAGEIVDQKNNAAKQALIEPIEEPLYEPLGYDFPVLNLDKELCLKEHLKRIRNTNHYDINFCAEAGLYFQIPVCYD